MFFLLETAGLAQKKREYSLRILYVHIFFFFFFFLPNINHTAIQSCCYALQYIVLGLLPTPEMKGPFEITGGVLFGGLLSLLSLPSPPRKSRYHSGWSKQHLFHWNMTKSILKLQKPINRL